MFTNSPSPLTFCPLKKKTCPHWTIYSWQGLNSLGCPLMLTTNYRCFQSLNISVDVAKCVENVHKFTQSTHFLSVTKNDLSWLNNLFMARFQLIWMSSYAKNKLQMSSVTHHQCRRHQMCENDHKFTQFTHFLSVTKNNLSWFNNLFMARFQLTSTSSQAKTNYRCVRSLNIRVDVAKCVENVHTLIHYTYILSVTK